MRRNSRLGWIFVAVGLTAVCLFQTKSALAQTQEPAKQTPEVQQLKDRLQQLEQTVLELKTQINALEETKTKSSAPAIVEATYSEPAAVPTTVPPAKPQDSGQGESSFQVYGFAMLDAGYQFKQNDPDWFDVVRPTKLPSFPDEFAPNGNTYFGVRQSRLVLSRQRQPSMAS